MFNFRCPNCNEPMLYTELCNIWQYYSITSDGCVDYESPHPKLEEFVDVEGKGVECPRCKHFERVDTDIDDDDKIIRRN